MKKQFLIIGAATLFAACNQPTGEVEELEMDDVDTTEQAITDEEQEGDEAATLRKVWETDTVLTTNESVLYDEDEDILYVSNISGEPTGKDGVGFISKLSPEGTIQELKWVTGLDAPKGMAISDGKLYVTNINELVAIDIASGSIENRYSVPGAKFLNDVATKEGKIYFSDSETGKVHLFEGGEVSTLAEGRSGLNGLQFGDGHLYALDGQGLRRYPLEGSEPEMVSDGVTGGDGLVHLEGDAWLASRWQGEVYLIQGGNATKLLDTKNENLNTADIGYVPQKNLVLVPTFFGNKVAAYELSY